MISNFKPLPLPKPYAWVGAHARRYGPNIVREALKTFGLKETKGGYNTDEIIDMAEALGGVIEDFYTADSIPWCGLAVSYWIMKAGFKPPINYSQVRARDFATWGKAVKKPAFGDILVFWRGAKNGRDGHVGLYVMENEEYYYVLGGNQSDQVKISKLKKSRLLAARRCPWRFMKPRGVKSFQYAGNTGKVSVNEA